MPRRIYVEGKRREDEWKGRPVPVPLKLAPYRIYIHDLGNKGKNK